MTVGAGGHENSLVMGRSGSTSPGGATTPYAAYSTDRGLSVSCFVRVVHLTRLPATESG